MSSPYLKIKNQQKCSKCNSTDFETNDQGIVSCSNCGVIQQQTKYDNNVVFGEQQELQGKNINKQQKFNQLSSEKRLKRAGNKIQDLVQKLQIPPTFDKAIEAAHRLLRYADNCNFFKKGKKIQLYAAAALYITLRFQKAPYLLIDFSDKMGIKMFPLARCFLKMSKKFGFQQELPLIDPSLLIHRYCKLMNLGDKTESVTMSAIRLIKRMKRDWMCQGRRPSSLCGAAILIATKIHGISNQHCSTTEICKTVFVCDQTIRRRLDQFKQTKISKLTLQQFERQQELLGAESQMDPPAFRKARLRSQQQQQIMKDNIVAVNKKQDDYDEYLQDIPQFLIQKYSDEIARQYEKASDRIPVIEQLMDEENDLDQESNNTGKGQLGEEESDNSDIDEKLIFLDQKQQQERKRIWQQYNKVWLDKQAAKEERGQLQIKKKQKKQKNEQKTDNPFEALLKNPVMGQKVNKEELKKLLASQPKLKQQQEQPQLSLNRLFDPYKWSKF